MWWLLGNFELCAAVISASSSEFVSGRMVDNSVPAGGVWNGVGIDLSLLLTQQAQIQALL